MTEKRISNFYHGVMSGVAIGLAVLGTYQIVKLGVDWTKAGIQELKDRKEDKLKTKH